MKARFLNLSIEPARQIAISGFLLFHLITITLWAVPLSSPLVLAFREFVRPYMLWSGLFQAWDTFAPSPKLVNTYMEANVIGRDGRIQVWKFPRMEQLSLLQRYSKERYRKFTENIADNKNSGLLPAVARHLARSFNNPANPPEIVMLIQHWSDITLEGQGPEHAQVFFVYRVQPRDLE